MYVCICLYISPCLRADERVMYVHIDRIKTCTYIHTAYIDQAKEERRKKEPIIPIPPSLSLPIYIYPYPSPHLTSPTIYPLLPPLYLYTQPSSHSSPSTQQPTAPSTPIQSIQERKKEMCSYTATHHATCGHTTFALYTFCLSLLHELNRINDPLQRRLLSLPFDSPECPPRFGVNVVSVVVVGCPRHCGGGETGKGKGTGIEGYCSACLGGVGEV